eukprot:m.26472 g.26472  ORF g.26472 m.26472 type:complete len:65 (-) comp13330_c0_seq1:110-304(-)
MLPMLFIMIENIEGDFEIIIPTTTSLNAEVEALAKHMHNRVQTEAGEGIPGRRMDNNLLCNVYM